ncbi:MAG TPA: diol dehydratase reactivase subunit alpha, partial [Symbiobacteriaceae bacterium]|nr:diol dehydratase reactivase subunit alpha [Symbiobacteriaceae bacterium]
AGTNAGGMIQRVRQTMGELTEQQPESICIQDLLAIDTMVPQRVVGGLAREFSRENAVALAAMVKTSRLPMAEIARRLEAEIGVKAEVAGREAAMAIRGALTTPGVDTPVAVLDMGGGSTDAAYIDKHGKVETIHTAGAGDLVTMLLDTELGLEDRELAEALKRYPLAKSESLFHIRLEDGNVQFFEEALAPELFGRLLLLTPEGIRPVPTRHTLETVKRTRREIKRKVFVTNALRALERVAPGGNIRSVPFVVFVGGSALDFEVPQMVSDALAAFGIVAGSGNIRGTEGPRGAVSTGLVLAGGR